MRIQNLPADDVPAALHTHPEGLSDAEAQRRLAEYGKNILRQPQRRHLLKMFLAEFTHFFALILWVAALICFASAEVSKAADMNTLGGAIVGVIIINAIFSFWQSLRAERALEALEKLLPQSIHVLRSNMWALRSAEEVVPGDVIEIREGERIGADVRLIESYRLRVDTSHLTGESIPSFRHAQADASEQTFSARNLLLAGMKVVAGRAKGIVFATGDRTEFGKIAKLTLTEKPKQSPLQEQIRQTSQRIAVLATLVGVLFFFAALATGLDTTSSLIFGIGLIVANIPEGLMPTLTMSLAIAAQRMAKKKPW